MKSSQFTDKQIMELSRSHSADFSVFSNPQDEAYDENDDGSPSFRFHPIQSIASDSLSHNCSCMDRTDSAKVGGSYDAALVAVIDRRMKELAENLIHAVEGISARVSQLDSRTRRLENSIEELKDSVEFNYGRSDGKLRELEIILREVQGGIQDLRDKQEIAEAKLQLSKLQLSRDDQQSKNQNSSVQNNSAQGELSSVPQQIHQPLKVPVAPPQKLPALPIDVLPTFPHWYTSPISSATATQLPTQLSQNQIPSIPQADSYYPPPVLTLESSCQQYHMPPTQQSQQPPQATHQPYQPAPQLRPVSQLSQLPQLHPPPSSVTPYAHYPSSDHPKEIPYMSSQTPPSSQRFSHEADGAPPPQQFYLGSTQQIHDQASSNPYSGLPSRHSQPPGISNFYDLHSYSGAPSCYSSSTMKPSPSPLVSGGDHLRLPTAQTLPHAIPMAANVDGGSGSGGTRNSIPIDNVVDSVVAMGFRRDLVRATVRKLTENGQSVDLNMVLDKLMNNGEVEPQSGRFGR